VAVPTSVIFDVGHVLFDWDPRVLYERLIPDGEALDVFLRDIATREWHYQHDQGRPFAETSAELSAKYPDHAHLIAEWGPRFSEQVPGPMPGMVDLVAELDEAGVPLYAITNFSGEFFAPFRAEHAHVFDRFGGIIVSGDERLVKPDPAIYRLALDRYALEAGACVFVDDRQENVDGAEAVGMIGVRFEDAASLRARLVVLGVLA